MYRKENFAQSYFSQFAFAFWLCILSFFCVSFSPSSAYAQQYSGAVLSDFTDRVSLEGRSYLIPDDDLTLNLSRVEDIIRSGKLHQYKSSSKTIDLGYSGKSVWLVLPISSISNFTNWKFSFGSQFSGRFAPLRSFFLYNMNTGKYLYTTDVSNLPSKIVPETFPINALSKNSTFLVMYLKSSPGVLTILKPEIINPRLETFFDSWEQWLVIVITLAGSLSLLVVYKTTQNMSYIFISSVWFLAFLRHLFITNFVYIDFLESDLLVPLSWVLSSFMFLGALWTSPGARNDLPSSLIIGAACLFIISSITGLILMHPMPSLSPFLLYGPLVACCLLISFSTWPFILVGHRRELLCLATSSFFLLGVLISIFLISLNFIPHETAFLIIPETLLCFSILSSVLFSSNRKEAGASFRNLIVKDNSFEEDHDTSEKSPLKEAKELSEHKRLIQVLEKERQNMAEMQVQSARQTEEMRKSKEAADEANRAKSAFLAIVSHEIRTPMTGIMGMVRLLQDTQLTKDQKEYAATIKDSGDAMLALLNDILDYEKIESGKMELEIINCDIKRLARSIHTLMSGHAASKNVSLDLEIDPNTPTWVQCDPTRLRQVILNLLNNALKFTSKGTVYLRIRNLTSEELLAQGIYQLYFAIQDSGIGISPEAQRKLFMPFSQADTSISRKYGGTGLGLAICKRLIETMGGGINISSKEGEGSTFFFTLNFHVGTETSEDTSVPSMTDGLSSDPVHFSKKLHLLVVDDNGINQRVVCGFSEKIGARCTVASDGPEALSLIAQNNFDLILMDIELPGMNGLEVTRRIRSLTLPHKASIPISALTGNIGDEDIKAYHQAGMNDFAAKPITLEKISELLQKADRQIPFLWEENILSSESSNSLDGAARPDLTIPQTDVETFETVSLITPPSLSDSSHSEIDLDTSFLNHDDELTEEEEDSFALAVRKFEEMEDGTQKSAALSPVNEDPSSLSSFGLDENMLMSLTSGLPADVMKDILVGFYEKADELIAAIGTAYLNQNFSDLKSRAHELKGMAGNFGFSQVSQMCAVIETAARNSLIDDAKEATEHLGEKYAMSRRRLTQWLENKDKFQ